MAKEPRVRALGYRCEKCGRFLSQAYVGFGLWELGQILKYIKEHGLEEKISEVSV
jgi:hypothetical protein